MDCISVTRFSRRRHLIDTSLTRTAQTWQPSTTSCSLFALSSECSSVVTENNQRKSSHFVGKNVFENVFERDEQRASALNQSKGQKKVDHHHHLRSHRRCILTFFLSPLGPTSVLWCFVFPPQSFAKISMVYIYRNARTLWSPHLAHTRKSLPFWTKNLLGNFSAVSEISGQIG